MSVIHLTPPPASVVLQVKEKIPELWERLSYLMDHNEERQQDAELWGTYRDHVNRSARNTDRLELQKVG